MSRRSREGRSPEIEAVYAFGDHPRIYYVEATRRYRYLGQTLDDCAGIGFGTGWFARDGEQVRSLDTAVLANAHVGGRGSGEQEPGNEQGGRADAESTGYGVHRRALRAAGKG